MPVFNIGEHEYISTVFILDLHLYKRLTSEIEKSAWHSALSLPLHSTHLSPGPESERRDQK